MAAPTGADLAIYNLGVKRIDYRLTMGLDYPRSNGLKEGNFSSYVVPGSSPPVYSPDPEQFWFTQLEGPPLVVSGSLYLRMYAGAPREVVTSRPHWFPDDPLVAFRLTIIVAFPLVDPVYSQTFTVGGIGALADGVPDQGIHADPLRVIQVGSLEASTGGIGDLRTILPNEYSFLENNDTAGHEYEVTWDPAAASPLLIKRDSVTIFDTPGDYTEFVRPCYFSFGAMIPTQKPGVATTNRTAAGLSPANAETYLLNGGAAHTTPIPLTGLRVDYVGVELLDPDDAVWPAWTNAGAATTWDDAEEGNRFTVDGEVWGLVPKAYIGSITVTKGRGLSTPSDSIEVDILTPNPANPNTTPNHWQLNRLVGRPIILDTRVGNEATSTWTAWRRQIVGIIETASWQGTGLRLAARDRPSVKLDTFFSKAYTDLPQVQAQLANTPEGVVRSPLFFDEILNDLVDTTDVLYGDRLGATDTAIGFVEVVPPSLSSGGQSLLSVFQELCDKAGMESLRRYFTSGAGRYGRIVANAWTRWGTAGYTFLSYPVQGAQILAPGIKLTEDRRAGTGQAYYRQDTPSASQRTWDMDGVPYLGTYPAVPYPPNDRVVNDSFAAFASDALLPETIMEDKNSVARYDGVAKHRYAAENSWRRQIEFEVVSHDWLEPADTIAVSDALLTGIAATEVWVVNNLRLAISGGEMKTTVQAVPTHYQHAIRRTT